LKYDFFVYRELLFIVFSVSE